MGECPHCKGTGQLDLSAATVGERIMAARVRQGLTQAELAKRVGLSRTQITNVEAGRSNLSVDVVRPMAGVLKISPEELIP